MELKPCPFCGSETDIAVTECGGGFYVSCYSCLCDIGYYSSHDTRKGFYSCGMFDTIKEAINAWNKRR